MIIINVELIKISFRFFLDKYILFISILSLAILALSFIYNTNFYYDRSTQILYSSQYNRSYIYQSINLVFVICSFLAVFLAMSTIKNYDVFLLQKRRRNQVIISKIFTLYCFFFLFMVFIYVLFTIIPFILMPSFPINNYFIMFLRIGLTGLFLITITLLGIERTESFFFGFFIIVFFWIMHIISGDTIKDNSLFYYLFYFFPISIIKENNTVVFLHDDLLVICVILILCIINIEFYNKKNIK